MLAWLEVTPKKRHAPRLESYTGPMPEPPLPELVEWLYDIGPFTVTAMGVQPISWPDILAWQASTGVELTPWEAQSVRMLSMVYTSQYHKAEEPGCPMPFVGDDFVDRAAVSDKVGQQFRSLAQRRSKGNGRRRTLTD